MTSRSALCQYIRHATVQWKFHSEDLKRSPEIQRKHNDNDNDSQLKCAESWFGGVNHTGSPPDEQTPSQINTTVPKSDLKTQSKHVTTWTTPRQATKVTLSNQATEKPITTEPRPTDPSATTPDHMTRRLSGVWTKCNFQRIIIAYCEQIQLR